MHSSQKSEKEGGEDIPFISCALLILKSNFIYKMEK